MSSPERPDLLRRSLPLAIVAGLLTAVSVVPFELGFPIFFAPASLLAALIDREGRVASPLGAIAIGLVMAIASNLGVLSWIPGVMITYGNIPGWIAWLLGFGAYLLQSLPFVIATLAVAVGARLGLSPWYLLPPAVAASFSLAWTLFPWRFAVAAIPQLPYAQLAELGGPAILDLMIAFVGCGLYEAWRTRSRLPAAVALGALVLPFGYGTIRLPMVEAERRAAPLLRVGVVQPNVGIHEKHDPSRRMAILERLRAMTVRAEAMGAEITVWPETAYPWPLPRALLYAPENEGAVFEGGVDGPLLLGAVTRADECRRWNSAVAFDSDGRLIGRADKMRLLPFTERIPLWSALPALQRRFPCPGFVPADEPSLIELEPHGDIGILNCYEDILPMVTRRVAREDPRLLINLTNDAWFGDTSEPHLHQLASRLRTIETRRDLVRVVNTGVSAHVSATGAALVETPTFEREVFVAEARLLRGETFFVKVGDWVGVWSALGYFGLTIFAFRRRRRFQAERGSTSK